MVPNGASHMAGDGPGGGDMGFCPDAELFHVFAFTRLQQFFFCFLERQVRCALQHRPCTGSVASVNKQIWRLRITQFPLSALPLFFFQDIVLKTPGQ